MQLSDEKKIRVMYRVEPGCLGPEGADHIEDFVALRTSILSRLIMRSYYFYLDTISKKMSGNTALKTATYLKCRLKRI